MYKARKHPYKEYVAIKRIAVSLEGEYADSEIELLKRCTSSFIVRLIDVVQEDNNIWVTDITIPFRVDCNGVLLPWLTVVSHLP